MPIFPAVLEPRGAIHIVAPSGAFDKERFEAGISILQGAGFEPIFRQDIFARDGYLAGDDERRLSELEALLQDPGVGCIWAARGGYGATRLLQKMGTESLARHPKWLVGFSDITALHCRWQQQGVLSLHGANITTLAAWSESAREELFNLLRYQGDQAFRFTQFCGDGGVFTSPMRGGNLAVLSAMVGSGALPDFQGACLFLEDIGEKPYRLDRALTQLKQSGAMDGVKAIALGQFSDCGKEEELDFVLQKCLTDLGVPIIKGLPVGHEASSRPLLLGANYKIDLEQSLMTLVLNDESDG